MASNLFVSRGGEKLQKAIDDFRLTINDKTILDVGSSTGGFVDCLLQNGAKKVYAVDTAYGELAWKLRNDPRVVVMERTNILHLESLPEAKNTSEVGSDSSEVKKVDLITIDAGWTKLELILPIVKKFLKPDGFIIALLKPHYEADKKLLVKGVLPVEKAEIIKNKVVKTINDLLASQRGERLTINDVIDSPILGGAGNKEYLLFISRA